MINFRGHSCWSRYLLSIALTLLVFYWTMACGDDSTITDSPPLRSVPTVAVEPSPTSSPRPFTPVVPTIQSPSPGPTSEASSDLKSDLQLVVRVESPVYRRGETMLVELSLRNNGQRELSFTTPTTQLFDLIVKATESGAQVRWADGQVFAQVITTHVIPSQGELTAVLNWDMSLESQEITIVATTVPIQLKDVTLSLQTPRIGVTVQ